MGKSRLTSYHDFGPKGSYSTSPNPGIYKRNRKNADRINKEKGNLALFAIGERNYIHIESSSAIIDIRRKNNETIEADCYAHEPEWKLKNSNPTHIPKNQKIKQILKIMNDYAQRVNVINKPDIEQTKDARQLWHF